MKYYFWLVVDKLTHLTFRIPRFYRDYAIDWPRGKGEYVMIRKLGWKFTWYGMAWTNYPCNRVEEEWEKREDSRNRR